MSQIKMISKNSDKKVSRKKFFLFTGASALGIYTLAKNPLKLFFPGKAERSNNPKSTTIKVIVNKNAVVRTPKVNNG